MKKYLFIAFAFLAVVCTGCKKENPAEEKTATAADFAGTYDLVIDWMAYMDGEYDEEGQYNGTLTITAVDDKNVEVTGIVVLQGYDVPIYDTKGVVDEQGVLRLEPSNYTVSTSSFDIAYGDIKLSSPLKFTSEMNLEIEGYQVVYEMENTATKQ